MKRVRFQQLLRNAIDSLEAAESTLEYEHTFGELLDFVVAEPGMRDFAESKFIDIVDDPNYDAIDLLEYCMHTLKWPRIRTAVEQRIQTSEDWREKTALSHVLEAFESDWDCRDLYARYRNSP